MSNIVNKTFPLTGMTCASCAMSAQTILNRQDGVLDAQVNFANSSITIKYNKDLVSEEILKEVLQKVGFTLILESFQDKKNAVEKEQRKNYNKLKNETLGAIIFTVPTIIVSMVFMHYTWSKWVALILTAPVIFYFGRNFYIRAFRQLKYKTATMDTLVATSTGVAFLFSLFNTFFPDFWISRGLEPHVYYEAATSIITFVLIGKLLEEKAKVNTSSAIKKLSELRPDTVTIIINDNIEKIIPVSQIKVNDIILVKPGDKIAVDGTVIEGSSFIDESMINGEPVPVEKTNGAYIYAGTINQKGSFRFKADKIGEDTVLSQIIKTVEEAQGSKAPIQKLTDKIASIFVPVVFGIAILTFIIWVIAGGENAFTHALLTSITVLVIACPCALGLATPTAIMVGIGKGAENNILIKDAESLEIAKKIDSVILDKTGTITEGRPIVTDIIKKDKNFEELYLSILLEIEKKSEHPLAEAIVNHLNKIVNNNGTAIYEFESLTGMGASAIYNGEVYLVGNKKLMNDHNISIDQTLEDNAEDLRKEAKTVIYFSDSKNLLLIIAIADKIKPTSAEAISLLQSKGINVYMLTGDNYQTAKAVAKKTGISDFKAEMLPADKAIFIKELQKSNKTVVMVGDGINDLNALAEADISIAMGKGSDIAMDVAKITITTSDLLAIPKTIELSKQTVKTIKQNLFWASIYNLIGIPIAAGILYPFSGFLLNPAIAAAAMAFSSISVVLNSLRLKWKKII